MICADMSCSSVESDNFHCRRRRILATLVLVFAAASPVAATSDFMAAGLMLVAGDRGAPLILLGRDRSRPWFEMPGGRRQQVSSPGENNAGRPETAYETAIREAYEESKGVLSRQLLRQATDPARFIRDDGFVFFLGEIDKVPVDRLVDAAAPDAAGATGFDEVVDYAWVSVDSVLNGDGASVIDDAGRRIPLRRQLQSRLKRARAAGWL